MNHTTIKLNEMKSIHIDFANRQINKSSITLNNNVIPYTDIAKYLGMNVDVRVLYEEHV